MSRLIIFFLFLSTSYGQHPYFRLTQEQLMKESKRDGYRVMTQLVNSTIVYTLTNDWSTIRVAYDPNSKLPSYIIYKEEE